MSQGRAMAVAAGGMIAMAAAMGIGRFVYTPILPFMEHALGISKSDAGLIATANFAGYLTGALVASWPALGGNRRAWFIGMLAVSVLPTGLMGATTSLEVFMGLRFAGGFTSAFVLVFGSALVLEALARYQRAALSALHFGGVGLGIAFSAILVAQIDSFGFDWRMQWFACALTISIATIAVALLVKQEDNHGLVERQSNSNDPQDKTVASGPPPAPGGSSLKALIIAYGLFGFGYVITATFISTMVRTEPDIRFLEPFIWLIVGLAGVPSVFIWSAVARRFGTAAGFSLACLIEAGAVAVSVLGSGPVAMITAALLLGGTFMGITALGLIRAREFNLQDSRKVLGLMTVAFSVGQMIGPTFAGYTWSFGNSFLFPSMTAATGLLIAAALTGLYKKSTA